MKIDKFLQKKLLEDRVAFENRVRQEFNNARKRYYAYPSNKHLRLFLEAKQKYNACKLI